MITVSINQLVTAIQNADTFSMPEMSSGVEYLHRNLFKRLLHEGEAKLSELDFTAFDEADLSSFSRLYTDVLERNYYTADDITTILRDIAPACRAVTYV